jgi:hypothetical protein
MEASMVRKKKKIVPGSIIVEKRRKKILDKAYQKALENDKTFVSMSELIDEAARRPETTEKK